MKLKSIVTYQYVQFEGRNENWISQDMATQRNAGRKDLEITLLPHAHAVEIKSAKDHVIVFTTNIAFAVPLNEETKAKVEKAPPKTEIMPKKG